MTRLSGPANKSVRMRHVGITIVAASVFLMIFIVTRSDGAESSYRLRVETMLPEGVSVRPEQASCPSGTSESPIDYDTSSPLADVLPLYEGDLISVRFSFDGRGSPMPDTVNFVSEWPQQVVGEAGPSCVFIVGESSEASVSWEVLESGATQFELSGLSTAGPTTLEVWLWATDPPDGVSFASFVTPSEVTDADVIDPLGGRLRVARRSSSVPVVGLDAPRVDVRVEGQSVVATVTNPSPTTRALDVLLELAASVPVSWQVDDGAAGTTTCTGEATLECRLGDLDDNDVVTVTATMTPTDQFEPSAVKCDGPPGQSGFGLCLEATVRSGVDASLGSASSQLIEVDRPADQPLLISVQPDPVIAPEDGPVDVVFSLISNLTSDLGSVRIVGSDCASVEQIEQPLDDGDTFLEPGERWDFACTLNLPETGIFRFDAAAVSQTGESVSATYEDFAVIVDPRLEVTSRTEGARTQLQVTNTGRGNLLDVAIRVPGCDSITLVAGDASVLAEAESVIFECEVELAQADAAVAYATGSDGSQIASSR